MLDDKLVFIQGHRADESLDGDDADADETARVMFAGTSAMVTASPAASVTAGQRVESLPDPWDRPGIAPPALTDAHN